MSRAKIILILVLAILLLPLLLWPFLKPAPPEFLNNKAPAYQTLQRAANSLGNINPKPSADELAEDAGSNAAALKILREALNQPFQLPEEAYSQSTIDKVIGNIGSFKTLAIVLKNEGLAAEQRNQTTNAVASYLDLIRFGQKIESGLLIFALIGVSIERMGVEALTAIEWKIEPPLRAQIAAELRSLNSKRVPFPQIEEGERFILRRSSPTPIHFLILRRAVRPAIEKGKVKYDQASKDLETLAAKFDQPSAASREPQPNTKKNQ
ncbi:MAG TPA: hypothetical protein VF773_10590 [Verrucomicrobiae bacterium]